MGSRAAAVTSMIVIPLAVAIVGNFLAIRWADRRGGHRRPDPPSPSRPATPPAGPNQQVIIGPATGNSQVIDQSRHHSSVTNNFGGPPGAAENDAVEEFVGQLGVCAIAVVCVAAAFVWVDSRRDHGDGCGAGRPGLGGGRLGGARLADG
jgi:hypothetical protein